VLRPKLAQLQRPFHPVMGNHENVQREGNPEYEAAYVAAFGAERVNYTFLVGSMRFVVLNNSGAPASNRQSAGRARNQWLRGVLESSSPTPVILCCHIPLVPVREEAVLKQSFGFGSYVAHDDELLELIDAHADRIVAVLSGHLHLTGVVQRHGVHHIVVSGPASYPCDFGELRTVCRPSPRADAQPAPGTADPGHEHPRPAPPQDRLHRRKPRDARALHPGQPAGARF